MKNDRLKIAALLRQTAAALRKQAEVHEGAKLQKCAQVLIAARGLYALQQRIQGATHADN
jgi:hypothetical protein